MEDNTLILIVDDDQKILQILSLYLRNKGFSVLTCENGTDALNLLRAKSPQLVLLDIMLPGMDGYEVLQKIRQESDIPIIMLTAKGDTTDRIQGLDCGADDYVVKPFDLKELLARIRAVLRRASPQEEEQKDISVGNIEISAQNYCVCVDGRRVEMPPKEIELLYFLASHPNRVFTREQLLDSVWGFEFCGDSRTVDVHIKRIRDRLGESRFWQIRTIWSVGYKFERLDEH